MPANWSSKLVYSYYLAPNVVNKTHNPFTLSITYTIDLRLIFSSRANAEYWNVADNKT